MDYNLVLYLVDAADSARFNEVKAVIISWTLIEQELEYLSSLEEMQTLPFGLLLNKSDLPVLESVFCYMQNQYTREQILEMIGASVVLDKNDRTYVQN